MKEKPSIFDLIAKQNPIWVKFFVGTGGAFEGEYFVNDEYPLRLFKMQSQILASPLEWAASRSNAEIFDYLEAKIKEKYSPTSLWGRVSGFFSRLSQAFSRLSQADYDKNFHSVGLSLLHAAVFKGDIPLAEKAIAEYNIDPNKVYFKALVEEADKKEKYYVGITPLALAFLKKLSNKREMAEFLLSKNARHCVEFSEEKGSAVHLRALSPLSYAIIQDDIALASDLIENLNAPLEERDHLNYTPLLQAARANTPEIAQLLIDNGAEVDAVTRERYTQWDESNQWQDYPGGSNALHIAAWLGHKEIITILLKARSPLDHIDQNGCTALTYAMRYKHKEITESLIEAGANPFLGASIKKDGNFHGQSALEEAVFERDRERINLFYSEKYDHIKEIPFSLLDKKSEEGEYVSKEASQFYHESADKLRLWRACRVGDTDELRQLLDADRKLHVSLLEPDKQGNTALHLACIYRQPKAVEFLLSKDENLLNSLNKLGETPFTALLKSENPCMHTLKVLLLKGSDVESCMTALRYVVEHKRKDLFEFLWKKMTAETRFPEQNGEGERLFLLAVKANQVTQVKEAIRKGVNIHCLDEDGQDALMLAAPHHDCEIAKLLIAKGVKTERWDQARKTTFQHALNAKNVPLCLILMAARLLFLNANKQLACDNEALNFLFAQINQVNVRDRHGQTLLSIAFKESNNHLATIMLTSINQDADEEDADEEDAPTKKRKEENKYCFEDMLAGENNLLKLASKQEKALINRIINIYQNPSPKKMCLQGKSITLLFNAKNKTRKGSLVLSRPDVDASCSSQPGKKRKLTMEK